MGAFRHTGSLTDPIVGGSMIVIRHCFMVAVPGGLRHERRNILNSPRFRGRKLTRGHLRGHFAVCSIGIGGAGEQAIVLEIVRRTTSVAECGVDRPRRRRRAA
ncbi:hypothetical protein [Nocardia sp. bgisy134]|uniref:hypothetical protein n=1 Tax=unclassified Nocardia TaxID=2637762 RepID=UPI003D761BA1